MWKRPRTRAEEVGALAGAERQQHFFAKGVFELFELQRGFTFVAQDFENRRATLFRDFHARIFQVHHMHLERLHEKILAVSTTRTRKGQICLLSTDGLYGMGSEERNENLGISRGSAQMREIGYKMNLHG
jgi:hypothetical protein